MKTKILTILLAFVLIIGATGCGKTKIGNTPETLEIYAVKLGYDIKWLEALIEDFKTQDWVKEMYPEMKIHLDINEERTFAYDRLMSSRSANTVDLFFGMDLFKLYGTYDTNNRQILANLNDLYDKTVPGENITFEAKMLESFRVKRGDSYYGMSWSAGSDGIMYNADLLKSLGLDVPVTTDELEKLAEDVKTLNATNSAYPFKYSFISSTVEAYWDYMMFPLWWAQYEGLDRYNNYYNGVQNEAYSNAVIKQAGRRESLKVIEKLLKTSNGYMFDGSSALDYVEAQTRFLNGYSLFYVCGDWFDVEMYDTIIRFKENYGIDFDITSMRTPVISAIVDKTPSIVELANNSNKSPDEVLSEVVKAIDKNQTSYEGVAPADFATVANARYTVETIGYNHNAVIPDYASAKDLAKDFLLYMATDRANEIYLQATRGAGLPFKYNAKKENPALYDSFSSLQKVRHDLYYNDVFEPQILPSPQKFPLVYNGTLTALQSAGGTLESVLFSGEKTAQAIYEGDIAYWTESRWNQLITNAGL